MRYLVAALFSVASFFVSEAQKTKSVPIEIEEVYPPKILLPTDVSTIDTVIINESGYPIDTPTEIELFEKLALSEKPDLRLRILLKEIKLTSLSITYQINDDSDYEHYKVSFSYTPNSKIFLDYLPGEFTVYRNTSSTEVGDHTDFFWTDESQIRKEDGQYYLRDQSILFSHINRLFVDEALSSTQGAYQDFLPYKESIYAGYYTVSDKKNDYSAIDEAIQVIKPAYKAYKVGERASAKEDLRKGAQMLESILGQADYEDKKAPVNAKVAGALAGTMAYAYEFAAEYEDADRILDLILENKLKLPGGFYFNPVFIEEWKLRLKEKAEPRKPLVPQMQAFNYQVTGQKKVGDDLWITTVETSPYSEYSSFLLNHFNNTHVSRDISLPGVAKMLYGEEVESAVKTTYPIGKYDGIEWMSYDEKELNYNIHLGQFTNGSVFKVKRLLTNGNEGYIEIAFPDGIVVDNEGYRTYNAYYENTMPRTLLSITIRKSVANYGGEWSRYLPNKFPVTEMITTRQHIRLQIEADGSVAVLSVKESEPKSKIDVNYAAVHQMRINKNKAELLSQLNAITQIDIKTKEKLVKNLERISEDYFPQTYNSRFAEKKTLMEVLNEE